MKKIIFLTVALLVAILLCACGEAPLPSGGQSSAAPSSSASGADSGDNEGDSTDGERCFKVYLECNGEKFTAGGSAVVVTWNNGVSTPVKQTVDKDGIATVTGLDGDYTVTLDNLPDGYTYNPNPYDEERDAYGHIVTNDDPEIIINVYQLGEGKGNGGALDKRIVLTKTNVYRATFTSDTQKIYFEFAPKASGKYTIESWVSVYDDKINPKIDVHNSNFAMPEYRYTLDTGAAEGKYYTKNFKYEVQIAEEMITEGGQVVFIFAIHTSARNDKYFPVSVDFAVKYEDEFELDHIQSNLVVPEGLYGIMAEKLKELRGLTLDEFLSEYKNQGLSESDYNALKNFPLVKLDNGLQLNAFLNENAALRTVALSHLFGVFQEANKDISGKSWVNSATTIGNSKVFLSDGYRYNEKTGFYHKYDEEKYADSKYGEGFGPILYADITESVRTKVLDTAFTLIEYRGNRALTVSNGTEDYKFFIESYEKAQSMTLAVLGGYIECPSEYENLVGYATLVNGDGAVPVTKELKEFLQKYSVNALLFMDGDGFAELGDPSRGVNPYESGENDQWLFACGYYE